MRCSYCNYIRKIEDSTPEWQCPNCKHVYDLPEEQKQMYKTSEKNKDFVEYVYKKKVIILIIFMLIGFITGYINISNIAVMIFLVLSVCLYFLPTLVAKYRNHCSPLSIFTVNLFFGWTLIGWVLSLAWALKNPEKVQSIDQSHSDTFDDLDVLAQLREKQIISEEEFIASKNKILGINKK